MNRTKLNLIIDLAAFAGFILLTTTGILMRYVLPPGSGHGTTLWHLDRHEWGNIHFWVSLVFFFVLSLHLTIHGRWITSAITGRSREDSAFRASLGIVGLITVLALSISLLLTPVERENPYQSGSSGHSSIELSIRGSLTLREIEETTGVPPKYIMQSLKLPESTSVDEPLSRLKRQYGLKLSEVRSIVNEYKQHQLSR